MTKSFQKIPDAEFGHSPSGWMDQSLFLQWPHNVFDPMITVIDIIQQLLLIVDGAHVHLSTWISEFCHEKKLLCYIPI